MTNYINEEPSFVAIPIFRYFWNFFILSGASYSALGESLTRIKDCESLMSLTI